MRLLYFRSILCIISANPDQRGDRIRTEHGQSALPNWWAQFCLFGMLPSLMPPEKTVKSSPSSSTSQTLPSKWYVVVVLMRPGLTVILTVCRLNRFRQDLATNSPSRIFSASALLGGTDTCCISTRIIL